MIILNRSQVRDLLPMKECIEAVEHALIALAQGFSVMPRRLIMWLPEKYGALGNMPAYLSDIGMIGLKGITVFPNNHGSSYPSHQGIMVLFDGKYGFPCALMDGMTITAIRTAAASAVATRALARQDASNLLLLGSGVQAAAHLDAMLAVRPIKKVSVWNPFEGLAKRFADENSSLYGVEIQPQEGARADLSQADIICTVTLSQEPILFGSDLPDGVHVNAVGASFPHARETDTEAVLRSRFFVDLRESAQNEAGDFIFPKEEGALDESHIVAEIGDVLARKVPGRRSEAEITMFKSLGLAVEDLAAANHVYKKALKNGIGTNVEI